MTLAEKAHEAIDTIEYRIKSLRYRIPNTLKTALQAGKEAWRGETKFESLDYVFVEEADGRFRVEHSFYHNRKEYMSPQEMINALKTCATFNLYAVVAFDKNLTLPRRRK